MPGRLRSQGVLSRFQEADVGPALERQLQIDARGSEVNQRARMIERGSGKIIFTASLLTFQGGLTVPGYAASKGALSATSSLTCASVLSM